MKNLVIFHIPRTAGKWVHETVDLNGYGQSVKWRGHIPLRDSVSLNPLLGRVAMTIRDPLSWYQSQENFTKYMAEPNPMKLLTQDGHYSLDEALSRMADPQVLRELDAQWPEVSFFKHKVTKAPWSFFRDSGLGLWSWSIVNALKLGSPRALSAQEITKMLSKVFLIRQGTLRPDLETLFGRGLEYPKETSLERDDRSSDYDTSVTIGLASRHSLVEKEMRMWKEIEGLDQTQLATRKRWIPLLRGF